MSRTFTSDVAAAIAAGLAKVIHLIELDFSVSTLYLTTAGQTITWSAHTWVALGGNLGFGGVEETQDIKAQGVQLSLSGVDQSIIALVLGEKYRGRKVKIYRAWVWTAPDSRDGQIIADPYQLFEGFMNDRWTVTTTPGVKDLPGTAKVETRVISRLAELEWLRGIVTNLISHQRYYPGDTFFQNTSKLTQQHIKWPAK